MPIDYVLRAKDRFEEQEEATNLVPYLIAMGLADIAQAVDRGCRRICKKIDEVTVQEAQDDDS